MAEELQIDTRQFMATAARFLATSKRDHLTVMRKQAPLAAAATPPSAPKTVAPKLAPGVFASAINLVMGRSANELILDETKKQTAAQREMAGQLKQINDKLTPRKPPPAPAAPVPMPVDTVPRFA